MDNRYKSQLDSFLQREISRSDFLKYIGTAMLGVVGIAGLFKHLNSKPSEGKDSINSYLAA